MTPLLPLTLALWLAPHLEAPHARDLERFPSLDHCRECCRFARDYRDWLELRSAVELHREGVYQRTAEEACRCHQAWSALAHAHGMRGHPGGSLDHLRELRWRIGAEAYHAGQMPPCVPLWRFARLD